jgi:hypothetical protein
MPCDAAVLAYIKGYYNRQRSNEFGFHGSKETLHRRIVPAICLAADGGALQDIPVLAGGVSAARNG